MWTHLVIPLDVPYQQQQQQVRLSQKIQLYNTHTDCLLELSQSRLSVNSSTFYEQLF